MESIQTLLQAHGLPATYMTADDYLDKFHPELPPSSEKDRFEYDLWIVILRGKASVPDWLWRNLWAIGDRWNLWVGDCIALPGGLTVMPNAFCVHVFGDHDGQHAAA